MKEYKIESKSTNGFWIGQGYREFKSDGEAKTFANNKSIKSGFEYRAKYIRDLATPKKEDVQNESEEQVEDNNVEVQTEAETQDVEAEVQTESEEAEPQVEETESEVAPSQIDYDFEDSHDEKEFPRGWWLQKEFVAKDGTVFKLKKEQPELYRTKKPSEY